MRRGGRQLRETCLKKGLVTVYTHFSLLHRARGAAQIRTKAFYSYPLSPVQLLQISCDSQKIEGPMSFELSDFSLNISQLKSGGAETLTFPK